MAEAAQGAPQEFWQPPSPVITPETATTMAETCPRCSSEFLLGAHFCHTCGVRRPRQAVAVSAEDRADAAVLAHLWTESIERVRSLFSNIAWEKLRWPSWAHYLHFHEIQERTGLSTGSLIAFVLGLACVAGALLVGLLTAKTLVDWQAIQFYRAEWLLAATAAFVAGILLKRPSSQDE